MHSNIQEHSLESILTELREAPYRIGVFGEFSTGKSTFLNALMGEDILSVATEPTTATPTRIQYARVFNVLVYGKANGTDAPIIASLFPVGTEPVWARLMKDGVLNSLRYETGTIRNFLTRWTSEGMDAHHTGEVLIHLPQPFLKQRLALIDTPGVNNEFTKHQGITERVLGEIDLALCLIDARQGGKASEMQFIQSVVNQSPLTRIVVNKIDLIEKDEREELLETISSNLQSFWPSTKPPCLEPIVASSLVVLDPICREKNPDLAIAFDRLREDLLILAYQNRSNRILERMGDVIGSRLKLAKQAELEGEFHLAHEALLDLLTLHQEAELPIPDDIQVSLVRCENFMKGAADGLAQAHSMVDQVASQMLKRKFPSEEMKVLLRKAGEIFLRAQVRDTTFERLGQEVLGDEVFQLLPLGSPDQIFQDGHSLLSGDGSSQADASKGFKLISIAAAQGLAEAQCEIGECYYEGKGVTQNYFLAYEWFSKAAEQENVKALDHLGFCYEDGIGVQQNLKQAVEYYRKAAEKGFVFSQWHLGRCYENGIGVGADPAQAIRWYIKAAEQGNMEAQVALGICFFNGVGVSQNYNQAAYWSEKAADQGNSTAQLNLGILYINGNGVKEDSVKAAHLFLQSAESGDSTAQGYIGICYRDGLGVDRNPVLAVDWFKKGADQGNAGVQYDLGICYEQGLGIAKNPKSAFIWYQNAAEQGDVDGQCALGTCYLNGIGTQINYGFAIDWYKKAIAQGSGKAYANLGFCYANGNGVAQDYIEAKRLFVLAIDNGCIEAQTSLEEVEKIIADSVTLTLRNAKQTFKNEMAKSKEKGENSGCLIPILIIITIGTITSKFL